MFRKTFWQTFTASILSTALTLTAALTPGAGWAAVAVLPPEIKGVPYAQSLVTNGTFNDSRGHWAEEYLFAAGVNGLLRPDPDGRIRPDELLNKRDGLLAVAALAGWMQNVQTPGGNGTNQRAAPSTGSWETWGNRVLTLAAQKGFFPNQTAGSNNPGTVRGVKLDDPVTKEELALWIAKALPLQPVYGSAQSRTYMFYDWNQMKADNVPWMEAVLQQNLLNGDGAYLYPQRALTRAEAAAVLTRALKPARQLQNRPVISASVTDIDQISSSSGLPGQKRIHIIGPNGEKSALLLGSPDPDNPFGTNVAVWKVGPTDGQALSPGDQIELYPLESSAGSTTSAISQNSTFPTSLTAYYVRVLPTTTTIEGTLIHYDSSNGQMVIQDAWGNLRTAQIMPGAVAWISGVQRPLTDIPGGTYIVGRGSGNGLTSVTADLPVAEPGAIVPESLIQQGKVREITNDSIRIADGQGREGAYSLASDYVVRVGRELGSIDDVEIGDPVTLRFSDYLGKQVAAIEIPTLNRQVEGVYLGDVSAINPVTGWVTLRSLKKFDSGTWSNVDVSKQVKLDNLDTVTINGRTVNKSQFQRFGRGQQIIFSAADGFDGLSATRVAVIDSGSELESFNDRVDRIDIPGNSLKLDVDGSYLAIDPGTIVIRNGRLTDLRDLKEGDPILAYADTSSSGYRAALITVDKDLIQETDNKDGLVQGTVKDFDEDGYLDLNFYSRYRDNQWERFSGSSSTFTLKPARDTIIYDYRSGLSGTKVPVRDFLSQGPAGEYDKDFLYAFVQNGRPLAISIFSSGPSTDQAPQERTTLARVTDINTDSKTLTLEAVRDWSDSSRRWLPNPISLSVLADKAIVIDSRKISDLENLRKGDTCLIIRKEPRSGESPDRIAYFIFKQ
ncbi:hypothetical protein H1S01_08245 [Heliobacterium chlorum]|uniref:SLH domain-containing protein n=1 Tax=Heliobacterium chlorum TaxID=2698 RepID=A0ABR7T1F0_HELCL|nr:hypothetical protein [Heliobacterium chlorum]MBC9784501.1 hypothetical protein [Heliobacterium chlorum]